MTSNDGNDHNAQDRWEDRVAKALNAFMVVAIGLAIGALGVWALLQFVAAVRTSGLGPDTDWMKLGLTALLAIASIQILWFGARMHRSKRK